MTFEIFHSLSKCFSRWFIIFRFHFTYHIINYITFSDPGFSPSSVEGWSINGPVKLTPVIQNSVGNLERVWAYLSLKQLLEKRDAADDKEAKEGLAQEALRIALKYSFVSDVTSLVVVKPNQTDAVDTEDGSHNDRRKYKNDFLILFNVVTSYSDQLVICIMQFE